MSEIPDLSRLPVTEVTRAYGYRISTRVMGSQLCHYLTGENNPRWIGDNRQRRSLIGWLQEEIVSHPENFTSMDVLAHDSTREDVAYAIDWETWAKPNLPITADIVHRWDQFGMTIMAVGDGAQMILRPDELLELSPEIKRLCAAQLPDGQVIHAPDHLWSAAASNFFGAAKMPVASNFFQLINDFNLLGRLDMFNAGNVIEGHFAGKDSDNFNFLLAKIFNGFNYNLNIFYQQIFGEKVANEGPLAVLPSGVMAVGIITPQNEFYYAWTGDVDTFLVDSNGLAYKRSYDNVDLHDYVSRMFAGVDRTNREFMIARAEDRIFEVGNLNGRSRVDIHYDHFPIPVGGGVIMSTDGKRMSYMPKPNDMRSRRNINRNADIAATLNFRDPDIAHIELMHSQRKYRQALAIKKIPRDFRMIPDDATTLRVKRLK